LRPTRCVLPPRRSCAAGVAAHEVKLKRQVPRPYRAPFARMGGDFGHGLTLIVDLEHAGFMPPILQGVIREGPWPFSAHSLRIAPGLKWVRRFRRSSTSSLCPDSQHISLGDVQSLPVWRYTCAGVSG